MNDHSFSAGEQGHIAAMILLAFTSGIGLAHFLAVRMLLKNMESSYQSLNQRSQELQRGTPATFDAWGRQWPELAPRIDFGAYTKRQGEAEALCYYLDSMPPELGARTYLCD